MRLCVVDTKTTAHTPTFARTHAYSALKRIPYTDEELSTNVQHIAFTNEMKSRFVEQQKHHHQQNPARKKCGNKF